jgi:cell division cycle 20, cofactor of APC complex
MTRPYSTVLPPSTPIRTPRSHHHSSSGLKPSGFPAPVTPVVATISTTGVCATTTARAFPSPSFRSRQRPANLLFSTEPRHHRAGCIEPPSADRFIPNRSTMNMDVACRALFASNNDGDDKKRHYCDSSDAAAAVPNSSQKAYKRQMMSTLCKVPLNHLDEEGEPKSFLFGGASLSTPTNKDLENSLPQPDPFALDFLRTMKVVATDTDMAMTSPSLASLAASRRKLPDRPYKILDALNVRNDFYISVLSWNHENIIAVALGPKLYLFNVLTGDVHTIFQEGNEGHYIMSVQWCLGAGAGPVHSHLLAVTTSSNNAVMFFDCHTMQRVATSSLTTRSDRVFSMSWKDQHFLSAGTTDGTILNFDIRSNRRYPVSSCRDGHSSQVCGLAWSPDGSTLASGCNDDALSLWDERIIPSTRSDTGIAIHRPRVHLPKAHNAAIKAIAWCPHISNVLATGGGSRDRTIKVWNTTTGSLKNSVDTGSQVSSLVWSKHNMELCSSHGFEHNQVSLWHCHYPALTKMKDFKFHTDRILSMEMSPDGSTLATLGGDQMLCLWDMFARTPASNSRTCLLPSFGVPEIR